MPPTNQLTDEELEKLLGEPVTKKMQLVLLGDDWYSRDGSGWQRLSRPSGVGS